MPSSLTDHLENLKKLLIEIECSRTDISESDTRESLINPLIKVLGWSFDLKSVRSKFEIAGCDEPIDYAFFTEFDQNRPALLLIAKKLGSNLNDRRLVQDLCRTLGALGVRYGCLTDGGRYIVYSSRGSDTSEHRQIMDLDIRAMDTVDGLSKEELEHGLVDHLSRQALQDQEKCQGTEQNYKNASISAVLKSLLSEPFDTAVWALELAAL